MADAWATLDELLGTEAADATGAAGGIGRLAFYGRCSTEDNQDPRTSLSWQRGEAERFVAPLGGEIVAEYFDIGQSRSLPWERREEASQILDALKQPKRGWDGLVVGEATRCWYGNQFSLTWPKFDRYGVMLWIPSLGGVFDPQNTAHDMAMTITGGLSKSERQHVQRRVRAAMAAQVLVDGRHQGGRAPYGYRVVDAGPHPNSRKAQEGYRLRVLEVDAEAAPVVQRIFAMYLDGLGLKAIAATLNLEGIACPSAHTPRQNRHRRGDGWQHATVKAILENPRYTGYAIYGRSQKVEELLDPDDVAAGHVVRFRRSPQSKIVRSREPAHPELVTVEDFTQVQLEMRARRGSGRRDQASRERTAIRPRRTYLFRGIIRCAICGRKMPGATRKDRTYYHCEVRSLVPGSEVSRQHPPNIYLRESRMAPKVNAWISRLFEPKHIDGTIAAMVKASDPDAQARTANASFQRRVREAEAAMARLQRALDAGWEPEALKDQFNAAAAEKRAAQAELAGVAVAQPLTAADVHELLAQVGDVQKIISDARTTDLAQLYQELGLSIIYDDTERTAEVTIDPASRTGSAKVRVRGGT
jgi:DNA invertase Pin-like site-specific DNA recombinase